MNATATGLVRMSAARRIRLVYLLAGMAFVGVLVGAWLIVALPYHILPKALAPFQLGLGIATLLLGGAYLLLLWAAETKQ